MGSIFNLGQDRFLIHDIIRFGNNSHRKSSMFLFDSFSDAFQKVKSSPLPDVNIRYLGKFSIGNWIEFLQIAQSMFCTHHARYDSLRIQTGAAKQTFIGGFSIRTMNDFHQIFQSDQWSIFEFVKNFINDRFMRDK